jgi:uncharacterized protein YuzE
MKKGEEDVTNTIKSIILGKGFISMKIYYDKEVDAAHIRLSDENPSGVIEVSEGINVDTTGTGEIVGIEILDASKKFPLKSLFTCEFDSELLLAKT